MTVLEAFVRWASTPFWLPFYAVYLWRRWKQERRWQALNQPPEAFLTALQAFLTPRTGHLRFAATVGVLVALVGLELFAGHLAGVDLWRQRP
jgi:hypothetical protein